MSSGVVVRRNMYTRLATPYIIAILALPVLCHLRSGCSRIPHNEGLSQICSSNQQTCAMSLLPYAHEREGQKDALGVGAAKANIASSPNLSVH